ncbi:rubredoxin [Mucilaginibacter auburnensis]|uniref:Rubredoxin n=1 Tax=Mucilaginibacter auburnensis TaxID=1457233 RepID=A0A2H9VSK7_9SPHI|nr:rubredoxin [Mucilaginibacter auburnensis]PJJ83800.1 rubredoxin [Mucilaginibacter auburnensis]
MEHLIKINLPGGFISAGDLYEILEIAESAGAASIRFGNRQQLYFTIAEERLEDLELDMLKSEISYEVDADQYPNIISSYVTDTIFTQFDGWLREGVYKDIFDAFDYQPQLKVNLVDNYQSFVPFFSGHINFIASGTSNYWYTYVRFPKTDILYCLPTLVYSEDIPVLAKSIEHTILNKPELFYNRTDVDTERFYTLLQKQVSVVFQPVTESLKLPDFFLPYYEGFNKYSNKYWLGVYRRNELFSIGFLKDVCLLCLKSRIGQIYTTPWKSLIIKGIDPADRNQWGLILSKYHLNIRHAANELNWQVEDVCREGLDLKLQLVRQFEEADLRTYQLSFAIKTQPKTGLQGAISIKKEKDELYSISHTRDFNPNSREEVVYADGVEQQQLSTHLIALCHSFQDMQCNAIVPETPLAEPAARTEEKELIYECSCCLTRYDKTYGDPLNDIAPGTDFEQLATYNCPVCDAPKSDFRLVSDGVDV